MAQISLVLAIVDYFCDNTVLMLLLICSFHRFQPLYRKRRHCAPLQSALLCYCTGYILLAYLAILLSDIENDYKLGALVISASISYSGVTYLHFITCRKIIRLRQMPFSQSNLLSEFIAQIAVSICVWRSLHLFSNVFLTFYGVCSYISFY